MAVHAAAQETIVPIFVIIDEKRICLSIETYFYYTQATDKAVDRHTVKAGNMIHMKVWTIYDILHRKMAQITYNSISDKLLGEVP